MRPHRWQPIRLHHSWDSPGKNTGVGCHFLLQCMKVKSLSRVWLLATPWTAAYQAPPSMGFSRQEYWSGVQLPSPHSNPKEGQFQRSNYFTIVLISHTSKVMLKILHARLQQYMNQELPDVQLDLENAEEQEITFPTSTGSQKKQGNSKKTSASLTMLKPLTMWITTSCGQFLKKWEYQTTWPASWETCMQVKKL